MMKSFFKKLAFVMALAMVVSMVAPAGSALAAEAGVSLQGTKTIVETYELDKVGATVDFSFQGAPSDWKTTFAWTSSNEAVATVNKAGVVTAVAAGTATITITAGADASYVETVVVTVKAEKAANAFEVAQANPTTFTMTFDAKKDVKADDVAVVMMINDVEAPIPVKAVSVNENVATVTLFSDIIDGITYKVTYGKETQTFVGSIGEIDHVAFEYYTVKPGDNVAYVSTEEEPSNTTLVYSLYDANGVDVTSVYGEDELTIDYELAAESDAYEIMDNQITFYQPGAAVVNLTVTWTTDDAEDVVKAYTGVVVATKRPALAHTLVKAGFINTEAYKATPAKAAADFVTNPYSFIWSGNEYKTSWILGDGGDFQFAALVSDNRGNKVVTGLNQKDNYALNSDEEVIYPYGYFKFVTSNDDVVDIDDEGILSFWGVGSASIITYFVDTTGEEEKEVFIGATKLTVQPARYVASYSIVPSLTIGTAGSNQDDYRLNSFVLTARDQYGANINLENDADDITVKTTSSSEKIPVKEVASADKFCSTEGPFGNCSSWWCGNSQGGVHYHVQFDSADFKEYLGKDAYKTIQYSVSVDKEENPKVSANGSTKMKLVVKNNDKYNDELNSEAGASKYYYTVRFLNSASGADLVINNTKNFNYTRNESPVKSLALEFLYLDSNGFEMAKMTEEDILLLQKDQKTGEAGKLYFEVVGPKASYNDDGTSKNWSYAKDGNQLVFQWNTGNSEKTDNFKYAASGSYTVNIKYVKNGSTTSQLVKYDSYSFNISNSQASPKFAGYDSKLGNKTAEVLGFYVEADEDVNNDGKVDDKDLVFEPVSTEDLENIVKANLDFTYDGSDIKWGTPGYKLVLKDYDVTAKKLRVNKVDIYVPLDDGTGAINYQYKKTVTVGKTIYYSPEE